jgi:pyruvate formate lyase activating enzyme
MVKWIAYELGSQTILHLSRYFPRYKFEAEATSIKTLMNFYNIASRYLDYVYLGNVQHDAGQDTRCSECEQLAISRTGYSISIKGVDSEGKCTNCGNQIFIT